MQGYDRDEYEDLDEYEEEGEEQEEEGVGEEEYEEEEEAPQPTQEELDYLELRQRLKESFRKQIKKESGSSLTNSHEKKKLPYDNYGSFFGPSQPVIAQRVIQESKSLLENQHLAPKVSNSHHHKNKSFASTTGGSRTQVRDHPPKVVNQLKMKAQKLKDTRDYSFLLSDDAELPAPRKDPPPRNVSVPNSEARSAQVVPKSKQLSNNTGKQVPNGREERKPVSTSSQMHSKVGSQKLTSASKPILASVDSRKQLGRSNGSGPGRPPVPKGLPSKVPAPNIERRVSETGARSSLPSAYKTPPSKLHSSAPKQPSVPKQPSGPKQPLDQKRAIQDSRKGKMLPKQPMPSSKPQINKPPTKIASCPTLQEDRPKKKPARHSYDDDGDDDDDDGRKAISMIRRMFSYNPRKFRDDDDDDSDMEANFNDILKEEKMSARIARQEDEEELLKIEEEERQERLRKQAKKRKLSQR